MKYVEISHKKSLFLTSNSFLKLDGHIRKSIVPQNSLSEVRGSINELPT